MRETSVKGMAQEAGMRVAKRADTGPTRMARLIFHQPKHEPVAAGPERTGRCVSGRGTKRKQKHDKIHQSTTP